MLVSYTEGHIVLALPQLRNFLVALAVKKYIGKYEGIEHVVVKDGQVAIDYNPAILPTKVLLTRGQAELAKYGIGLDLPENFLSSL